MTTRIALTCVHHDPEGRLRAQSERVAPVLRRIFTAIVVRVTDDTPDEALAPLVQAGATIHRASVGGSGATRVGAGCMIMAMAHVAHDCQLGDGVILANNVMLGGHVHVGDRAFIGGGAAVHQTVRIGRLAMVSGLAGVTNDIPPFGYVFGLPARLVGFNRIGLLRSGCGREQLRTVRAAHALLFKEPGEFAARLEAAEARFGQDPLVAEILAFIRDPARRRQLVRPGRMAAPELGPGDDENGEGG